MSDTLGQQYTTPEQAIIEKKCDVIIVGRGILKAEDRVKAAAKYKQIAYDSYLKRIRS
jgi:uridine monophosphate synthetase